MNIQFATCTRSTALKYLQRALPSRAVSDTDDCAKPLLDLVEQDIVRIQDPTMYGSKIGVVPGKIWNEQHRDAVTAACKMFA